MSAWEVPVGGVWQGIEEWGIERFGIEGCLSRGSLPGKKGVSAQGVYTLPGRRSPGSKMLFGKNRILHR